ncbi:MAG: FG-GAP-like repeat-containing protein [Phycisphaerales bacterium]
MIASALAVLTCAVTSSPTFAGPPGAGPSPYSVAKDIDRDGQPGGIINPFDADAIFFTGFDPESLAFAAAFGLGILVREDCSLELVPLPEQPTSLEAADLNGDAINDELIASFELLYAVFGLPGGGHSAPTHVGTITGSPFANNSFILENLNNDNRPEIVAVSNNFPPPPGSPSASIQIFPKQGNGTFSPQITTNYPGFIFQSVDAGDLENDGKNEIIVATSTAVSIFRNTASNTLTPLNGTTGAPLAPADPFNLSFITFPSGTREGFITDVNGDNKGDLVTSNFVNVSIRINNGDNTFAPVITLAGESGTQHLVATDVNKDGNADIFSVNQNQDEVNLWLSTGPGLWAPRIDLPAGARPDTVLFFDTNGDNLPDLNILNQNDGDLVTYLNSAPGSNPATGGFIVPQRFANSFPVEGGYTSVTPGDFNADGYPDIFAATQRGDIDLFLNRTDGSGMLQDRVNDRVSSRGFFGVTLPPPPGLAGDGRDRMGIGIINDDRIAVFQYDENAPPTNPYPLIQLLTTPGNLITSIATCDLNADGITDIAVTLAGSAPAAQVFLGDSTGLFGNPVALNLPTPGWDQFIAPFATSGLPANRYYIADYQTGNVLPLDFAAGAFTVGTPFAFGANCTDVALADINGDGIDDLISARTGVTFGEVIVQTNITAAVPPPSVSTPLPRNPAGVATGDINGDGKDDVIVSTTGPTNQNQYVISILNGGTALDPNTATLHPAGERPARPILVDLHLPLTTRGVASLSGPEAVIPNRDAVGFNFNASVIVLPNQIDFAPPPPPPACRADFNADGIVNTADLIFFLGRFGQTATPGSPAARADFNNDGVVNTPDLTFFLGRFSQTCP